MSGGDDDNACSQDGTPAALRYFDMQSFVNSYQDEDQEDMEYFLEADHPKVTRNYYFIK